MPLPRVFFDLTVADRPLGRVIFELFTDVVPKTAENFRSLCTGETSTPGKPMSYTDSPIHRVIDQFMIQGGDFTKRNGTGGESIYGGTFKDERLTGDGTALDRPGLLVMANRGPDTNGSQFFVTLAGCEHLNGKHVVFGRVVSGMQYIEEIGKLPTDERDRPLSPVVISRAGELELRQPARPAPSLSPDSDSEEEYRRRKAEKRARKEKEREDRRRDKKDRKRSRSDMKDFKRDSRSPSETLSELDARLEREEKERLEVERLEQLAKLKDEMNAERQAVKNSGGVVYKGRGMMRYRDPEGQTPNNYSSRGHDTRSRYRGRRDEGGRWERGTDARPQFDKGRDMDRWGHGGFRGERGRGDRDGPSRGGRGGRDGGSERPLADRVGPSLNYNDEPADRDRDHDRERRDPDRSARANAWRAARKSPSPRRSPARRSASPAHSAGSDMVMDD